MLKLFALLQGCSESSTTCICYVVVMKTVEWSIIIISDYYILSVQCIEWWKKPYSMLLLTLLYFWAYDEQYWHSRGSWKLVISDACEQQFVASSPGHSEKKIWKWPGDEAKHVVLHGWHDHTGCHRGPQWMMNLMLKLLFETHSVDAISELLWYFIKCKTFRGNFQLAAQILNVKWRIIIHNLEYTWQYPLSMFYSEQGLYVVGYSLFTVGSLYDYVIRAVLIATRCITND